MRDHDAARAVVAAAGGAIKAAPPLHAGSSHSCCRCAERMFLGWISCSCFKQPNCVHHVIATSPETDVIPAGADAADAGADAAAALGGRAAGLLCFVYSEERERFEWWGLDARLALTRASPRA